MLTRRAAAKSLVLAAPFLSASAHAATGKAPGVDWEKATPQAMGFKADDFEALSLQLCTLPTTAFMVVSGGKLIYSYGDIAQACYLASARKSILSMLYGKYVAERHDRARRDDGRARHRRGRRPAAGREDRAHARPADRKLRRLSSGRQPGRRSQQRRRAARKQPGAHFHYNNWDFNVLGAMFEKLTGKTVFAALDEELARPLRLQDFDLSRQRMMGFENRSRYPRLSPVPVGARHGAARPGDAARRRVERPAGRAGGVGEGEHAGARGGERRRPRRRTRLRLSLVDSRDARTGAGWRAHSWRAASSGSTSWCCRRSTP